MAGENENVIKAIGIYAGHSARGNFDVELKMIFTESHISEALQFVAGIGQHLKMIAEVAGEKVRLGTWGVYRLAVDRNAQTTVVFKANAEHILVDNLSRLMVEDEEIILKAQLVPQ